MSINPVDFDFPKASDHFATIDFEGSMVGGNYIQGYKNLIAKQPELSIYTQEFEDYAYKKSLLLLNMALISIVSNHYRQAIHQTIASFRAKDRLIDMATVQNKLLILGSTLELEIDPEKLKTEGKSYMEHLLR